MAKTDTDVQDAGAPTGAAATRIDAAPGATAGDVSSVAGAVEQPETPPAAPSEVDQIAGRIRAWAYEHLSGGPIARNTECWNHLHDAIPALANLLAQKEG